MRSIEEIVASAEEVLPIINSDSIAYEEPTKAASPVDLNPTAAAEVIARIDRMQSELDALRHETFDRVSGRLFHHSQEQLAKQFSDLWANIIDIKTSLNDITSRLDSFEPRLSSIEKVLKPGSVNWRMHKFLLRYFRKRYGRYLVESSGIFDAGWYLDRYPDVRRSGVDPLSHFIDFGIAEGRAPNPSLETASLHKPVFKNREMEPLFEFILVAGLFDRKRK